MFRNCKPKRRSIYAVTLSGRWEILTEAETEDQARENVAGTARRLKLDFNVTKIRLVRHGTWVYELKGKVGTRYGQNL